MTQRPDKLFTASGETAATFDIDKLISESTEPSVWKDHLVNDLMKFWGTKTASTLLGGLFPTYRCNDGSLLPKDKKDWPEEYKAAAASPDTSDLVDPDYNYMRAHARQTFAYGIAFNITGNQHYLELCRKGVKALVKVIDGNFGFFSKMDKETGECVPSANERNSQDMAYGLTGLAMYYYLTHDNTILHSMLLVKEYLFKTYFDENKGFFTWLPKNQNDGDIEIVAQLDQLYAYMLFVTPSLPEPYKSEWLGDLKNIANILINRFYSERYGFFWGVDSNSKSLQLAVDHTDFGHSVKTMWVIYRIGLLVGETSFVLFAREKIDKILAKAYLEDDKSWGRRFNADGKVQRDKEWWILAELDQATQLLALNDPSYLSYLNNTHKYWLDYMVDKEYGEIWHWVNASDNKPDIKYPKAHKWKTSFHSFEHALFGYVTSSQIKDKPFTMYYAFPDEKFSKSRVRPYLFDANIVKCDYLDSIAFQNEGEGRTGDVLKMVKVTYDKLR